MQWQQVLYKDHRGGRSWPPYQTSRENEMPVKNRAKTCGRIPPKKENVQSQPWVKIWRWATHVWTNTPPTESQDIDRHRIFRSLRKDITSQSANVKRRYTLFGAWFQHAMSQPTLQRCMGGQQSQASFPQFQSSSCLFFSQFFSQGFGDCSSLGRFLMHPFVFQLSTV